MGGRSVPIPFASNEVNKDKRSVGLLSSMTQGESFPPLNFIAPNVRDDTPGMDILVNSVVVRLSGRDRGAWNAASLCLVKRRSLYQ